MTFKNIRQEKIELVNCNLCGQDNTDDFLLLKDYKYVRCHHCGLIYQNPRPVFQDLKFRYSKKYFQYEFRNHYNFFLLMKHTLKDINFLKRKEFQQIRDRTFLDIGCATGLLLNYIRPFNWKVQGVEICRESVDYARKNFHLDIFHGSFEQARFKGNTFDVIHFSHLIEHLPDPLSTLRSIYRVLKKGGYILVTTPRQDSFQARIFQSDWRSFHRDHLTIFTKDTLTTMIKKAKFNIKRFISWGGIAKGSTNDVIKFIADKAVKLFNIGDVMFILAQK
ncbi:MAG: class I SAM-dependent methyltransferase [Spirochaetes bacterium]|nr:class I SAM-dependent methyltransferase [Spirochaetota bacterium]